ncbi:response regulator [Pontixanthobacter gangjinensis]|uniref:Response regulator n=1 Tax=Christiangramia aestuarii TaxID=1028746 RepID=A0A7K1LMZ5_9FLAO|nr:response regulator [Christiangramia aestuarii]MUP42179.1 response regulator [Christiangramia aestuarii]
MKKSVWVIDDDEIYQLIIKKLIRRSEVFEEQLYFRSAREVLEQLDSSQVFLPDVILLDINMPMLDGWQFIDKLKSRYEDFSCRTTIYIVSSSIAYSDRERAERYPEVSGFISKPMTVEKLRNIGEAIHKKKPGVGTKL